MVLNLMQCWQCCGIQGPESKGGLRVMLDVNKLGAMLVFWGGL